MSVGRWLWGALVMVLAVVAAVVTTAKVQPRDLADEGLTVPAQGPAVTAPVCTPVSLEERAGRVLLVGLPGVTTPSNPLVDEVLDVGVGGVMLTHANVTDAPQVRELTGAIRARARTPMLVAADEEPGRVRAFGDILGSLPSARRLAAQTSLVDVKEIARQNAASMKALGINLALAPVADLDAGPWNGVIGDRSFSGDPAEASQYVLAYAHGLRQGGVTPVVKHFPGHGQARGDDHLGQAEVNLPLTTLTQKEALPFADAIRAGVPVVMMGNVAYDALEPDVPAGLSAAAYKLLRDMGFTGVAITDSIGMGAVNLRWDFDEAAIKAVAAGADGVLATDGRQARRMQEALVAAVRDGRLDERRLSEAAARMAALAGADPMLISCQSATMPVLR
ncbi:MAG: glycoside hydrolase family 3 N-terminal domain-containing protein [Acidimicrobiales bacterium]